MQIRVRVRKAEQEEELKREELNPRKTQYGRDKPSPAEFDPAEVEFNSSHYERDATDSRIKKALFDIGDLQVSVLCALDSLIQDSFTTLCAVFRYRQGVPAALPRGCV